MGATQSVQVVEDDEEEEESEDEEEDDDDIQRSERREAGNHLVKKVLEQEPEMLPCHASASPLSPQLSSLGTPRLGPSIKVWDPYNVLAPPPPLPPTPVFSRVGGPAAIDDDRAFTEVFLISHGECDLNLRSDLVVGRCHAAALTPKGKRQARALAVFFNSQGIRFNTVYTSPLDRARSMAVSVCQELNFPEEDIQQSDALAEMSMGDWEGCHRSEIYSPDAMSLIETSQPDFSAPSGESLRQVEFRMVQFLNGTIVGLPEKLKSYFASHHHNETLVHDHDGSSLPSPHSDLLHRHRPGLSRKKSGKSRLQIMKVDDEMSPRETNHQNDLVDMNLRGSCSSISTCIGVFTHSVPIKCLLTGLLGCSPVMLHKICVEDSSVTVLQHSSKTGWQIKRLNDTAHLRLL